MYPIKKGASTRILLKIEFLGYMDGEGGRGNLLFDLVVTGKNVLVLKILAIRKSKKRRYGFKFTDEI